MMVEYHLNHLKEYLLCIPTHGLGVCYSKYDSLSIGWAMVIFLAIYCFVASIIGNNCSKVDQLWSITPVIFAWHFFAHNYLANPNHVLHERLFLTCILITIWGVRLTFNFWRKGGYGNLITHEEDYRWPILRAKMSPLLFLLFNFSFIACYQNALLYCITVPLYEVGRQSAVLTAKDFLLIASFMLFFGIETIADEQHFQFQSYKHRLTVAERACHKDKDIRRGFFTQGLFYFSRHPNYFAEQAMWVTIYLFSLDYHGHTHSYYNWTIIGCLQLILLFQGSMTFGESITIAKYPEYREYQWSTNQCLPWLPFPDLDK